MKKIVAAACAAGILAAGLAFCLYGGILWFNSPWPDEYPVRGVDVSHHQGAIVWPELAAQGVRFAFVKATEGRDFKDTRFAYNLGEAAKAGLAVGAYHFFLCGKPGAEQARNFINAMPTDVDALPPVLDMECPAPASEAQRQSARIEIGLFLEALEAHYGKRPIIYTTYAAYEAFIGNDFRQYPLWIRSVFTRPDEDGMGRDWLFWQYSSRGRLSGYDGPERFIDLNVFNGSEEDFIRYLGGNR